MNCSHCKEDIDINDDHFTIQCRSAGPVALYFHNLCFTAMAGPEFGLTLATNANTICLSCLKRPRIGGKIKTCSDCTNSAPSCPQCQTHKMVLRVNKSNAGVFWSCSGYPTCKKTLSVR